MQLELLLPGSLDSRLRWSLKAQHRYCCTASEVATFFAIERNGIRVWDDQESTDSSRQAFGDARWSARAEGLPSRSMTAAGNTHMRVRSVDRFNPSNQRTRLAAIFQ